MVMSIVLYWPVAARNTDQHAQALRGSPRVRRAARLAGVVSLAMQEGKPFNAEPRGGPWASVITNDRAFADSYAKLDVGKYKKLVADMCRTLFDRDTSPGAEPEDMLKLEIPALVIRDATRLTPPRQRGISRNACHARNTGTFYREQTEQTLQRGCWVSCRK